MKTIFFIWSVIKLFFFTSVIAANPGGENDLNPKTEFVETNVTIIHLTEATFKQMVFDYEKNKEWKYAGKKPAIIDFYADWCAPCQINALSSQDNFSLIRNFIQNSNNEKPDQKERKEEQYKNCPVLRKNVKNCCRLPRLIY